MLAPFIELAAPFGVPFWEGAGAATAASEPEFALAAESAAKVGAVEGAEKPPSEDAIARTKGSEIGTHQATSRATADNL